MERESEMMNLKNFLKVKNISTINFVGKKSFRKIILNFILEQYVTNFLSFKYEFAFASDLKYQFRVLNDVSVKKK